MNPQNGIVGDQYGTELPEAQLQEEVLNEAKGRARFSKTKEYQELKTHLEQRIDFYKKAMPNGEAIIHSKDSMEEIGKKWLVANTIVAELEAIIQAYEDAVETVKNSRV